MQWIFKVNTKSYHQIQVHGWILQLYGQVVDQLLPSSYLKDLWSHF